MADVSSTAKAVAMPIPLSAPNVVPPCFHLLTIYVGMDRIDSKIVQYIAALLGHHIHMCLQNDTGGLFTDQSGPLADNGITSVVLLTMQVMLFGKFHQISGKLLLMVGRMRNGTYGLKVTPKAGWL